MPGVTLNSLEFYVIRLSTPILGLAAQPGIVAALVVWRVVTLIGTLVLGALTCSWWRWQTGSGRLASPDVAAKDGM